MCECIDTIESKLEGQKLDTTFFLRGGTLECRPRIRLMRADNGREESRRNKPSAMAPTFCPFCGERYEKAPD